MRDTLQIRECLKLMQVDDNEIQKKEPQGSFKY